jgi:signal transduction histidine kinase
VRLAQPLVSLAGEMERIGERLPEERSVAVYESRDEIGQLGTAFKRMVGVLREKQLLERQVMASERLAALGRLAAGIAHEINNPLGGMLNAISTFKRHARQEPVTAKTLSLLERGLSQIRDTVAALLVEARVESHSLTPQDVDDTHTLLASEAHEKRASFDWENGLEHPVRVPSTQARQILINLLLNAVHAIEPGGRIACSTRAGSGSLRIQVTNDGSHIPEDRLPYLFEPFSGASENGHGLGLWVTYQIVQQLNGGLSVTSIPGETRFTVELPIESPA